MILAKNFKFLPSLCMANMKLEMMFGDVSECWEGHFDHIWRFSNLAGGHLGFFSKGLTYDFGQKFQISSKIMYGQHEATTPDKTVETIPSIF